jgi:hypothetical protein
MNTIPLAFISDMDYSRMEQVETYCYTDVEFQSEPATILPVVTRKALQIVRAKTCETELRLLSESSDGQHQHFIVETVNIAPYLSTRVVLLIPRSKKQMNESEAISAFEKLISQKYPPVVMKNGKSLPIHLHVL